MRKAGFRIQQSGLGKRAFIVVLLLVTCHLSLATALAKKHTHPPKGGGAAGTPLTINTVGLLDGQVGVAYSQLITASGGTTPYTFAVTSCSGATACPPPGIALTTGSPSATLAGTPTADGIYSFTVRATDSAAHTYSLSYAVTVAAAVSPSAPLFSDGFESGNFAAWTSVPNGAGPYPTCATSGADCALDRALVQSTTKHAGTYGAQLYYFICSDSANPACGAAHQDTNTTLEKDFAAGFIPDHFFMRGYFRFHINAGGTGFGSTVARKMFYLNPTVANTWHMTFGVNGSANAFSLLHSDALKACVGGTASCGGTEMDTATNRTGVAVFPCGQRVPPTCITTADTVAYHPVLDQWYYAEVEVQLNTLGLSDGYENVWVQAVGVDVSPILVIQIHNANIRDSYATGLALFQVGNQADRNTYNKVDELRYLDDIAIAATGPIGP